MVDKTPLLANGGAKETYFWGDDPMDTKMAILGIFFGAIFHTVAIWVHGGTEGYYDQVGVVTRDDLNPMFVITILWGCIHQINHFIGVALGLVSKNASKSAVHISSRMAGNMDEWSVLFIVMIWMYALYFNVEIATVLGACWLFHRFSYGYYYAYYGKFTMFVEFSTQPQYQIYYTLYWVMVADIAGYNLIKAVCKMHPALMFPTFLLFHISFMFFTVFGFSTMWASYFNRRCPPEKDLESP